MARGGHLQIGFLGLVSILLTHIYSPVQGCCAMPCDGWNHSASCDCGWGGRSYGRNLPSERTFVCTSKWVNSQPGRPLATSIERLLPGTPRRFTNPNAHCPVCGASVFYFQNEFGSRVFFDDLGVPWPKHPCTDNDIYRYSRSARILACELTTPTRRSNVRGYHWRSLAIWRKLNGFVVCTTRKPTNTSSWT